MAKKALKRIPARFLLGLSTDEMWDTLTGDFILVFDDGEIETNDRETLYSGYAWDFHRIYPDTPLLMKHHVHSVLAGGRLGSSTHLELLGNVLWSVYHEYVDKKKPLYVQDTGRRSWRMPGKNQAVRGRNVEEVEFRDFLFQMSYATCNKMYNDLIYRLEEYVVSLDITDFTDVMKHPKIEAAVDGLEPTQNSINDAYTVARQVLLNGEDLATNPLSLAVRSKLINMDQLLQCTVAVGFRTDTDSQLFRRPVLRGFAHGLRYFYDSLIESRSAAKALIFSKTPLQQAEYFSRRLQLMSQLVKNLHPGDCGTQEYLLWYVHPPQKATVKPDPNIPRELTGDDEEEKEELQDHPGDLKQLVGKYYLDEATGKLKVIRAGDKHLERKTLKLRSVIHCAHPDPYGICATCFGELALSVPAGTNIGQMCCTSLAQQSSQKVLSVKHSDSSSAVEGIILSVEEKRYLRASADENSYLLSEQLKNKHVLLVIPPDKALNITDITEVDDVTKLNITRVSEFDVIGMHVTDPKRPLEMPETPTLEVSLHRRMSSMTYALLSYIRQHGWGVDKMGNYTVDLKDWDWNQPLLTLPLKHFNMSDHSKDIASRLESSVEKMQERDSHVSPDAALIELFGLVNKKLAVNLAVLDVVLYASMIISADQGLYGLPKPWTPRRLGVMKLSMANRSASAAMAFEQHREFITSPLSYTETNRPDHPFDAVIMPAEVLGNRV